MGKRRHVAVLMLSVVTAAGVASCSNPPPAREISVVARGMAFVMDGAAGTNPTLLMRAGERVRLVLRNDAPGLLHDLAIPAWDVSVEQMRAGETRETTFTVPATPGRFEYLCRPHSEMMKGSIEVTR